jgi:hypothetical protein
MGDFAYTTVPGKIKPLLEKVRQVGIPAKATVQWLKTVGFKSSNDAGLIGVLKVAGLIDPSGVPTSVWSSYRGSHHKKVLGDAIRIGYAELFAVYPNAWESPNSDLENVFSTSSTAGKQVIAKTVSTFKALCECAEFATPNQQTAPALQSTALHSAVGQKSATPAIGTTSDARTPSVHIDIQIHISPEASVDQIDQIFKSMSKHLYGTKGA